VGGKESGQKQMEGEALTYKCLNSKYPALDITQLNNRHWEMLTDMGTEITYRVFDKSNSSHGHLKYENSNQQIESSTKTA
jgi:hypothetical protein